MQNCEYDACKSKLLLICNG